MLKLTDLVTPQIISTYWDNTKASQEGYLGEALFPARKQAGLEISMIRGRAGLPVTLKSAEFDTNAPIRERLSIEELKTEMPFFRERMTITEKLRQELIKLQNSNNSNYLKPFLTQIFDDTASLLTGAKATRERMAMQLITSGKIKFKNNGVSLDYDYKLKKNQFVAPTIKWTDHVNSTPLQDLVDWTDDATKLGFAVSRLVINKATMADLRANVSIRSALYKDSKLTTVNGIPASDEEIKQIIKLYTGFTVSVYDKYFTQEVGGICEPFFPDGKVVLLPASTLGEMVYGTTPEEADLLGGTTAANVYINGAGVAVTANVNVHPVNIYTMVSQIVLPTFNATGGNLIIATVN